MMDAAVFIRSRRRLGLWLGLPPLLTAALLIGARLYKGRAEQRLQRRREMAELLPRLEQDLQAVRAALRDCVAPTEHNVDAAEAIKGRLLRTAQELSFAVNSLAVEHSPAAAGAGSLPQLKVRLSGEAPLETQIRLLDALQRLEGFVSVDALALRMMGLTSTPLYSSEIALSYCIAAP